MKNWNSKSPWLLEADILIVSDLLFCFLIPALPLPMLTQSSHCRDSLCSLPQLRTLVFSYSWCIGKVLVHKPWYDTLYRQHTSTLACTSPRSPAVPSEQVICADSLSASFSATRRNWGLISDSFSEGLFEVLLILHFWSGALGVKHVFFLKVLEFSCNTIFSF